MSRGHRSRELIILGGNYLGEIFLGGICAMGNCLGRGGNCLGDNCPRWEFFGGIVWGELSRGKLSCSHLYIVKHQLFLKAYPKLSFLGDV